MTLLVDEKVANAIDVSVYGGGVTASQCETLKAVGVELIIVGLWHGHKGNRFAAATLKNAHMAGLRTAGYTMLVPGDGALPIKMAQHYARDADIFERLAFLALDCEWRGLMEEDVHRCIMEANDVDATPVIYTGAWFWKGRLHNPTWAFETPLWDSDYDKGPDEPLTVDYGGWTNCVGRQYRGTDTFQGVSCDLNVFDRQCLQNRP